MFDFELFLEIAERVDPRGGALDLQRVERIAFRQPEFAADHLVLRQRVAVDIDPFNINARRFSDLEGQIHCQRFFVARIAGADIGEGIAKGAGGFIEPFDGVFHHLRIVPVARLHRQRRGQPVTVKIAQLTVNLDLAELVALAFFDHVGDDEVLLVRGQFGHGGNHPEIGVALGQVELAQLLLVKRHPVRIVGRARAEEAVEPRLLGDHFAAQIAVGEIVVAQNIDLADFGLRAFGNFVNDIDAVLVEHHHLGFDRSREPPLALVQLDNPRDVSADF